MNHDAIFAKLIFGLLLCGLIVSLAACAPLSDITTDLNRVAGWNMMKKDAWSTGQGSLVEDTGGVKP